MPIDPFEVFVTVYTLLPGFLAFYIARWLSFIDKRFTTFELTMFSLLFSVIIFTSFSLIVGIGNFDSFKQKILIPENIGWFVGLTIGLSLISALVLRLIFNRGVKIAYGSIWENKINRAEKSGTVIVSTKDNKNFIGEISRSSRGEHNPKEIVLNKPYLIERYDDDGKPIYSYQGEEIYFLQTNINRIVFLKQADGNSSSSQQTTQNLDFQKKLEMLKIIYDHDKSYLFLAMSSGVVLGIGYFTTNQWYFGIGSVLLLILCVPLSFLLVLKNLNDIRKHLE